jgi:flagellar hook-basal body complex protein FliE
MISSLDLLRYNASTTASNAVSSTQLSKALEKIKDGLGITNTEEGKSFDNYLLDAVSSTQLSKALEKTKDGLGITNTEEGKSFDNYLLDAISYVNDSQNKSSALFEQVIIDPDSVDAHDVTIAMAEANLSLSLAQAVIDRMIKGWSEITTTR